MIRGVCHQKNGEQKARLGNLAKFIKLMNLSFKSIAFSSSDDATVSFISGIWHYLCFIELVNLYGVKSPDC